MVFIVKDEYKVGVSDVASVKATQFLVIVNSFHAWGPQKYAWGSLEDVLLIVYILVHLDTLRLCGSYLN